MHLCWKQNYSKYHIWAKVKNFWNFQAKTTIKGPKSHFPQVLRDQKIYSWTSWYQKVQSLYLEVLKNKWFSFGGYIKISHIITIYLLVMTFASLNTYKGLVVENLRAQIGPRWRSWVCLFWLSSTTLLFQFWLQGCIANCLKGNMVYSGSLM